MCPAEMGSDPGLPRQLRQLKLKDLGPQAGKVRQHKGHVRIALRGDDQNAWTSHLFPFTVALQASEQGKGIVAPLLVRGGEDQSFLSGTFLAGDSQAVAHRRRFAQPHPGCCRLLYLLPERARASNGGKPACPRGIIVSCPKGQQGMGSRIKQGGNQALGIITAPPLESGLRQVPLQEEEKIGIPKESRKG